MDMLDQWLYSLKHMDALDEVPAGFDSEEMSSLYTAAEIALFDGDKRIKYEKAMMYERDYNNDMYYANSGMNVPPVTRCNVPPQKWLR